MGTDELREQAESKRKEADELQDQAGKQEEEADEKEQQLNEAGALEERAQELRDEAE